MNVITGETTHVRPRIEHQEQIAALTADQVLGDLPIQTPQNSATKPSARHADGSKQRGDKNHNNNHGTGNTGLGSNGSGIGSGLPYTGAGAGSLYIPGSPGIGFSSASHDLGSSHRGVTSPTDGEISLSSDEEAMIGNFDHLDLMDEFDRHGPGGGFGGDSSLPNSPPFGSFPPSGMSSIMGPTSHNDHANATFNAPQPGDSGKPSQPRTINKPRRQPRHSRARRRNSAHSTGSEGRAAAKGHDSSSANGANVDDATRKRRRRNAERLQQRKEQDEQKDKTIKKLGEEVQSQQQQIAVLTAENTALKQQIHFLQDLVKNSMMQKK